MWQRDGRLVCDTCTNNIDWDGVPRIMVIARAREMGWHCFEGANFTGDRAMISHICPLCVGTPRSKLPPAPPSMTEDVPLFEVEKPDDQPTGEQSHKGHRRT